MYPVSADFLAAMKADRRQVLAKAEINYTDPFIDQSIAVAASEQANVSYPAQTADAVQDVLYRWASLDGSWVLDGSYRLAPTEALLGQYQFGWWGSQLAGADGSFASPYPALTVTHLPRPVHTLKVVGDSARGEYPVDFQIDLYAQDNTLLYSKAVTGNTLVAWTFALATPVLDVARQVLTITRWSHPGRQAKIVEFFTSIQETYLSGDLVSLRLIEEREASQGSLPVGNITANEITLVLNNESKKFDVDNTQSPLYGVLKPNRRVKVWLSPKESDNLCPPFSQWLLGGTATVDAIGVLHLSAYGDYAESPLIRIDGAAQWMFSAEFFDDQPAPVSSANPDGTKAARLLNSSYFAADGVTAAQNSAGYTGNGNAASFAVGAWCPRDSSAGCWGYVGGPNVTYIKIRISTSSSWTSPSFDVRLPMLTIGATQGIQLSDPGDTYANPFVPYVREEWVPLGTFWSLDWDSQDDTLEATVTARDRMELLRTGAPYQSSQVQTNVSLYTLAEQVLQDAGLTSSEYAIDTSLQSIVIPYAWFDPVSHREALRTIAEAALAVVYADRDGIVRIEPFALSGGTPVLTITEDDYFLPLRTPSRQDQVANEVIVTTQPLRPATVAEEVYRSNSPITVPAGGTVTVTAYYNQPPVIEAVASLDSPPAGVSITAATYYGWGAQVSIQNTGTSSAQVTLVISGKPLTVQNKERAVARDETSITENGVLRYEFPENRLVQTLAQAQQIADTLLASVKDPRRDIEMDWRGNPALLLGDRVTVKAQDYHVIRQEIEWAGALSAKLTGRKAV